MHRMMRKCLSVALCFALAVSFCALTVHAAEPTTTIMIYLCGSDLESDYGYASLDLAEMAAAGIVSEGPVRVLVETGGASVWSAKWIDASRNERWLLRGDQFVRVDSTKRADMGDPATLRNFISFCVQNYPADRYGLVLWNHGKGSTFGVCFDEETGNSLTTGEIHSALAGAAKNVGGLSLDFIAFDACMMANFELANYVSEYAGYMIASEELVPGSGFDYQTWLSALRRDPSMSTESLCRVIADSFYETNLAYDPDDYVTLSVLDLSQIAALTDALEAIGEGLCVALDAGGLRTISRYRHAMRSFGEYSSSSASDLGASSSASDLVDLRQFVEVFAEISGRDAEAFQRAFDRVVVYNRYTENNLEHIGGLSILVPNRTREDFSLYRRAYDPLSRYPRYAEFITGYAELMNGGSYVFSAAAPEQTTVGALPSWLGGGQSGQVTSGSAWPSWLLPETEPPTEDAPPTVDGQTVAGALPDWLTGRGGEESSDGGPQAALFAAEEAPAEGGPTWFAATERPSDGAFAYSIQLSEEDLHNLSYVEGNLMLDISDDEDEIYIDLGYLQHTAIDWDTGVVYSLFDGTWPMLEDQLVYMTDQSVTADSRRSLIDVRINGEDAYLIVAFDEERPTGEIIGYTQGANASGFPLRGHRKLSSGDVIVPLYYLYYVDSDGEMQVEPFEGDPIVFTGEPLALSYYDLTEEELDFAYAFCLNDIFGDYQFSDFLFFSL